ncbi:hydroxymethylbilane synthase [Bacteriovorax sp. Seq25_V]|uniref:hydroxymethylbilane synthase n=1 Tax=Bacteriovorax sp. Seq25_V TaxID=1201288 RepID=UPI00038A0743|nr:hydroxymethylbilane synthase [Bacteriovorax sp. Seq25_V]EQC46162.1 hydroxymethylbilane synthase [Bacteriovorax sp. Seq25_V]
MSKKSYIIGTRGSLLALTQCGQVKDELERLTGDNFELKIIKTQGDQITDKPLWQLEGKDFFTKELDAQLLEGQIDLVVHSYKDLGSDRPEGIKLAAITKRSFAHDILFIKKSTIKNLHNMEELVVGTSSPRRIVNIEAHLSEYIPNGENLKISTKVLRGNVNSRIGKLVDDQYDAIVLAMPGIERLAMTESSRLELEGLIKDLDYMILPHSAFPAAASQGALAIEALENRDDDGELLEKLKLMEDSKTVKEVSRERQAFASYGGGCHLAVGINVTKHGDYYLHTHRGAVDDKEVSYKLLEGSFASIEANTKKKAFIGLPIQKFSNSTSVPCKLLKKTSVKAEIDTTKDLFVTSTYALETLKETTPKSALFCAGNKTWKKLAKEGFWVNGSSDSLGEDYLQEIRESKLLETFYSGKDAQARGLISLTHAGSYSKYGEVVAVYSKEEVELSAEDEKELLSCNIFYWTSFTQFQSYVKKYPQIEGAFHCSGLGKTFEGLKDYGLKNLRPFGSMEEFNNWLKK